MTRADPAMIPPVFWLLLLVVNVDSGKILVYSPSISFSHLISNGRIADALVMFIPEYMSETSTFNGTKYAKVVRMKNISRYDDDIAGLVLMDKTRLGFADRLSFEYTLADMCRAFISVICMKSRV
ncbi:hypothetical protein NECAME_09601 [Necator americanus]|uniref:Uncharacterized protein n=1 Tax=Necator americanus TaxID=51031 RepID=W2TF97_NECAM|nr:hypothetical protein NECAME_09601 [Necator americanus]ETN79846.1 hypothetical protein NECAME_09601 [Necator americanus]